MAGSKRSRSRSWSAEAFGEVAGGDAGRVESLDAG